MQPNSPLQPLQPMQPKVPGVPQVPDVPDIPKVPDIPQIPQTPNNTEQRTEPMQPERKPIEAPKITGVSLPAGSNKKPESPEQRNKKINEANAPKPKAIEQKQNLLHKPVTMEEVEEYRRKNAKKRKIIFVSILILLAIGAITTAVILLKNNQQKYKDLSSIYNDSLPIVIQNSEGKITLISQNGWKLSEKYDNIENFETDRSLAIRIEEDKAISVIIDSHGNEKYSTDKTLTKINKGQNYLISEDGKTYILNKDGKKLSDKAVVSPKYYDDQNYFLVADDNSYEVINSAGEQKIHGAIDKSTVRSFSYGTNPYDNNSYCAFINVRKKDSKLYIYNCETAKEIANIENVYYSGGFENSNSALLTSEQGSSYFYNDEMIYNSETKDQEVVGGIIKKAEEERYFNPVTRKSTESFPSDSLIKQDKLDKKADLTSDCKGYQQRVNSKLLEICNQIYYNNKQLSLNYSKNAYYLPNEKLDDFLSYNGKHYVYRLNNGKESVSIIDATTGTDIYSNVEIQANIVTPEEATSRFVIKSKDNTKTVVDLATGKSANYENNPAIRIEANYYVVVESTDAGYVTRYFNANHKEIYKEEN